MSDWDSSDVELLYRVNGWSASLPDWANSALAFLSEYGVIAGLMVLGLWAWWTARRRPDAVTAVAGLMWAPLGASAAYLVNYPIRELVARPRPFVDHEGLNVLVAGKDGYSFVSDHSALVMALAVGIFVVNRKLGALAIALALFQGFGRVYTAVHYPTDVVGGLALGAAVVLLLAPLAAALLTPLTRAVAASPHVGRLVQAPPRGAVEPEDAPGEPVAAAHGRDLAA
ncbi:MULTISPECIES: phosphatase PAP2 family protein [unclassified Streptomyces]|uniref:phosphatase PAP2 family protein n=1 Tax=unclassified Streptomyces TaxID=2593676 RepID=UPI0022B6F9EF|nr:MULTISPECIES: phosphatase PAP2 family protein [unclassified Streptomyces]MCZ7417475.1 phosphatase PAP2 family protein [Streptomyces sp. WMMC897]MCZ7432696.1 phosphatase PAP2 family protein [Streptomyces sp. WMMC1477]